MSRKQREEMVAVLVKRISEAKGLIVLDYTGLSVEKINQLRRQIRETGSQMQVAKNTLLSIAVQGTPCERLNDFFAGQTAVAFIDGDPALLAKVLTKFQKDNVKENPDLAFAVRAAVLDNDFLNTEEIDRLGNLPGRDVLLAQLVGMIAAPLTGFVSVLAQVPSKFLRVLTAIADQKQTGT